MATEPDDPAVAAIHAQLVRIDEALKAASTPARTGAARERAAVAVDAGRSRLDEVVDEAERDRLAVQLTRRAADLDALVLQGLLVETPGVARAPTRDVDPARIPPGQHLTPGWPVLHVGRPPTDPDPRGWTLTLTGQVERRTVLRVPELAEACEVVDEVSDLHCVTRWSRLDNRFTGVRLRDLLALAGPRPQATHLLASGHPAYSADLDLDAVWEPEPVAAGSSEVLVAWAHDGSPLDVAHGGPLRLVVPSRYGWKAVKWLTEVRLLDRDVPGYWEERGYHHHADPTREQRFAG